MNNSFLNPSCTAPYNVNSPTMTDSAANRPPSYVFGSGATKRRSIAISGHNPYVGSPLVQASGPSADIFASPIPSHVRAETSTSGLSNGNNSGKSVHWSPQLAEEYSTENRQSVRPVSSLATNAPYTVSAKGPPLRLLRDDVEPSPKAALIETETSLYRRESPAVSSAQNEGAHWVTIFGFTPEYTERVIKFFGRHGEIVAQKIPARGNWIDLRYSNDVHTRQALSRNGSLLDEGLRIGVIPTPNAERGSSIRSADTSSLFLSPLVQERVNRREAASLVQSPNQSTVDAHETSLNLSRASMASRAGMRPLAAARDRPVLLQTEEKAGSWMGSVLSSWMKGN